MSEKTNIEHFLRLHDQQLHANPCKAPKFSLNVDHDQQHIQVFADIWNRVRLLTQGPVVCLSWQIRKRNVKHLYLGGRQRYPDLEQGVYELGSWGEKGDGHMQSLLATATATAKHLLAGFPSKVTCLLMIMTMVMMTNSFGCFQCWIYAVTAKRELGGESKVAPDTSSFPYLNYCQLLGFLFSFFNTLYSIHSLFTPLR